ncbi:Rossmann-fold superfamily protein [Perilla frutescens var. hirtella]|nr:Rossmann-fold superfamily protein [Perilla frutescens var. hirtella]
MTNKKLSEIALTDPKYAKRAKNEIYCGTIKANKRYAGSSNWTVKEVVACVKQDFDSIDILVHSLTGQRMPLRKAIRYLCMFLLKLLHMKLKKLVIVS